MKSLIQHINETLNHSCSEYVNEWQLNDQSVKKVDVRNCNKLFNILNSMDEYLPITTFDSIGFSVDINNHEDLTLSYIYDELSNLGTIADLDTVLDTLNDKEIIIVKFDEYEGNYECVDIFIKQDFDGDYDYFDIFFIIRDNLLLVEATRTSSFGDYVKTRICNACKVAKSNYIYIIKLLKLIKEKDNNKSSEALSDEYLENIINYIKK